MKTKAYSSNRQNRSSVMATVGILSHRAFNDTARPFGPATGFLAECCQAAAKLDMRAVAFDAVNVDPDQEAVTPATVVDGRWVECGSEPWPAVIYDRASVLDPIFSPAADRVRGLFDRARIPFVNPLPFIRLAADKLETYRRMAGGGLAVPHTGCLGEHTLRAFLARYEHVYIKPRAGSQGTGVIEIVRSGSGRHVIRTQAATYEIKGERSALDRIMDLAGEGRAETRDCLVQQGLSAEPPDRRRFPRYDLRLLMQKDGKARWFLTGLVARVSQTGGPTANLSNGGRSEEAEPVLDAQYGRALRKEILRSAAEASFATCEILEEELGPIGELGLDIVPDAAGSPWIIEINAKPGRNVFKRIAHSSDVPGRVRQRYGTIRMKSVARPFEYAKALSRLV